MPLLRSRGISSVSSKQGDLVSCNLDQPSRGSRFRGTRWGAQLVIDLPRRVVAGPQTNPRWTNYRQTSRNSEVSVSTYSRISKWKRVPVYSDQGLIKHPPILAFFSCEPTLQSVAYKLLLSRWEWFWLKVNRPLLHRLCQVLWDRPLLEVPENSLWHLSSNWKAAKPSTCKAQVAQSERPPVVGGEVAVIWKGVDL